MDTNTPAASKIAAASTLSYNPNTDELFADGKYVGGASDLTRDLMIAHLDDDEDHEGDSDETLFDMCVSAI